MPTASNAALRPEGRRAKRKRETRAKLLEAGSAVISRLGVEVATIKDITDEADIGFGTFYSYFESKDALIGALLDCIINDIGRRNAAATEGLESTSPEAVSGVRMRLTVRMATSEPLWRWWALHPDLLFDRMNMGIGPFAREDIRRGIARGDLQISEADLDNAWRLAVWVMVGGIHDIVTGDLAMDHDIVVTESVLRLLGTKADEARRVASMPLPPYPPSAIDWDFALPSA